jgi:putative Mg2+ transporter-C (MgtC) family protein
MFAAASSQLDILSEILLALVFGGLIGLERETQEKPAGLRTHMLAAASATLFIALGNYVVNEFDYPGFVRTDPIRIIQAIIIGISFLGSGTIIQRDGGDYVQGLTTAASLLAAAGIGISVALRQFVLAAGTTIIILIVNRVLGYLGSLIPNDSRPSQRTRN